MEVARRVMLAFSLIVVLVGLGLATVPNARCRKPPFLHLSERQQGYSEWGAEDGKVPSLCARAAATRLWVAGTVLVGGVIAGVGGAWILRPSGGTPDS